MIMRCAILFLVFVALCQGKILERRDKGEDAPLKDSILIPKLKDKDGSGTLEDNIKKNARRFHNDMENTISQTNLDEPKEERQVRRQSDNTKEVSKIAERRSKYIEKSIKKKLSKAKKELRRKLRKYKKLKKLSKKIQRKYDKHRRHVKSTKSSKKRHGKFKKHGKRKHRRSRKSGKKRRHSKKSRKSKKHIKGKRASKKRRRKHGKRTLRRKKVHRSSNSDLMTAFLKSLKTIMDSLQKGSVTIKFQRVQVPKVPAKKPKKKHVKKATTPWHQRGSWVDPRTISGSETFWAHDGHLKRLQEPEIHWPKELIFSRFPADIFPQFLPEFPTTHEHIGQAGHWSKKHANPRYFGERTFYSHPIHSSQRFNRDSSPFKSSQPFEYSAPLYFTGFMKSRTGFDTFDLRR